MAETPIPGLDPVPGRTYGAARNALQSGRSYFSFQLIGMMTLPPATGRPSAVCGRIANLSASESVGLAEPHARGRLLRDRTSRQRSPSGERAHHLRVAFEKLDF
jgi:hypothetical protein